MTSEDDDVFDDTEIHDPTLRKLLTLIDEDPIDAAKLAQEAAQEHKSRTGEELRLMATAYFEAAAQLSWEGDSKTALPWLEASAQTFLEAESPGEAASALAYVGDVTLATHQVPKAIKAFELAIEQAVLGNEPKLQARCLSSLGTARLHTSDNDGAKNAYQQGLVVYQELDDTRGQACCLAAIADVQTRQGELQEALEGYAKALPLFSEMDDRRGQAHALNALGALWARTLDYNKASEAFARALPIFVELWDRVGEANTYQNLGTVAAALGQKKRAEELMREALHCHAMAGDLRGMGGDFGHLGRITNSDSQFERAALYFESSLALHREINAHQMALQNLNDQGEALLRIHGKTPAALADFLDAAELAQQYRRADESVFRQKVDLILAKISTTHPDVASALRDALEERKSALKEEGLAAILSEPRLALAHSEDQLIVAETLNRVDLFISALNQQRSAFLALSDPTSAMATLLVAKDALEQLGQGQDTKPPIAQWHKEIADALTDTTIEQLLRTIGENAEEYRASAVERILLLGGDTDC